jgi:hypothetical protein
MYPAQVGYQCRQHAYITMKAYGGAKIRTDTTSTTKVTAVNTTADGTEIVLRQKVATDSYVDGILQPRSPRTNQTLRYLLKDDGSLGLPFDPFQGGDLTGVDVTITGDVLYPPLADLVSGATHEGTMSIELADASGSGKSTSKDTPVEVIVDYTTSGRHKDSITVGPDRYRDIVEVTAVTSMHAAPGGDPNLASLFSALGKVTAITDFARGVGPLTPDPRAA